MVVIDGQCRCNRAQQSLMNVNKLIPFKSEMLGCVIADISDVNFLQSRSEGF